MMDDHTKPASNSVLRILCVEDNEPDFELVQEYLRLAPGAPDFELRRAENVEEARDELQRARGNNEFDIILTDLSLPGSSGIDTFLAVQAAAPNIPIAVMTGLDDHELGLQLVKEGAQDFLPKDELGPMFLMRSLLHAIERERNRVKIERLNDDLKSAQLQLIQAEKLESLGRLSAGVAHEIKNPLAMLQACVDFYRNRTASDEAEETVLTTMQDAIQRATRIVSGMLDFSRDEKLEIKEANLNSLIHSAIDLVEPELRITGIAIVFDLDAHLPPVNLDASKIEQILVNLLMNAMHASPAGTRITVRSYLSQVDNLFRDEGLRTLDHLRSGDKIAVAEVRDYGSGIPKDKIAKVFDPFFTTKPTGKGTGLGLSVSKTIAELHGGSLRIQNAEPSGICAQIILRA
jgi:signal transduction histidine kinase